MVYLDPEELKWMPYVQTWMATEGTKFKEETRTFVLELFEKYVEKGMVFIRKKCTQAMPQVDIAKVNTLCKLLEALLFVRGGPDLKMDIAKLHILITALLPSVMLTACTLSFKSCAILRDLMGSPPLGGINSAVITLDFFSKVC